ncbi:MAG TPA: ABC transporter permease subunit [Candidatus Thermoplasmatota archaeon]|nr:ABC transporter permease subunit [Candidatus Thermoplasmatota archaeon]
MRPRWVIAQKELAGIFKERTILLAVVIQVVVAGFSSFLVVGLSALVDPESFPGGAEASILLDEDASRDERLVRALENAGVRVVRADAMEPGRRSDVDVWDAYTQGYVRGAIFLEPGGAPGGLVNLTLVLPENDLRTTMTLTQVKRGLEAYERELRAERQHRLVFEPVYVNNDAKAGSYAFVYSLLVPLLVFLPVVLAGALCADSITEEVQRKTLPILLASPATPADVVEGKLLANVFVAPLLAVAWFLLLGINGLPVDPVGAVGILVLATAVSYLLGLLACGIALVTRDRNKAHVTYAGSMFLLLGLSLALPVSPINAVALLAADSAHAGAWAIVVALAGLAVAGGIGLRIALRRTTQWMAAGE